MLRRLGLTLAVLALFSIAGGHWAVLQTVAWAEMLRDYTQKTGSVAAAVEQTFDGAHPCELCRQIAAAKQQEKAKDQPSTPGDEKAAKGKSSVKAIAADGAPPLRAPDGVNLCWPRLAASVLLTRADQPPTPPPRSGSEA